MRPDLSEGQQYQDFLLGCQRTDRAKYRFRDEEYAILNMMDGQTSMETMKEEFDANLLLKKSLIYNTSSGSCTGVAW